ncbi:MAG: hypothetical protein ACREUU_17695 [Gammaproteobacteria bacterium]
MTKPRPRPAELPHWPRWLTTELAAAYVGISTGTFTEEVRIGIWPPKHPKLGRWDRLALDEASDRLSNPSSSDIRERVLRRLRASRSGPALLP